MATCPLATFPAYVNASAASEYLRSPLERRSAASERRSAASGYVRTSRVASVYLLSPQAPTRGERVLAFHQSAASEYLRSPLERRSAASERRNAASGYLRFSSAARTVSPGPWKRACPGVPRMPLSARRCELVGARWETRGATGFALPWWRNTLESQAVTPKHATFVGARFSRRTGAGRRVLEAYS